jgi:hypothetical protein
VAFNYAEMAVAAIELHREGNGVICAAPNYTEAFERVNEVHLTPQGYRDYGERLGVIAQRILDTGSWDPCHITGVSRSGSTITVTVHVPEPPLVTDTTLCLAVDDLGFTYDGAGINSVTITDDGTGDNVGTIEIALDASAGGTLGVAYNNGDLDFRIGPRFGPRTNIRDSAAAVRLSDGVGLYNWLCTDQWVVA